MRKLVLIAAVLALVVLVLLLARGLVSPPLPVPEPESTTPTEPTAITGELDADAADSARAPLAESALGPTFAPPIGIGATHTNSLRIHITFKLEGVHDRFPLDVRVSDVLGVQRDALRETPDELFVPRIPPGEYVVASFDEWWDHASRRVHVQGPNEEVRVELVLERRKSLPVRWRAPDGRPIGAALLEAPFEPGRHVFVVRASRDPIPLDGPPPESLTIASFQREVRILRDESTGKLVRVGPLRDPSNALPTKDDPFGILEYSTAPPFWVSLWSNGSLIDAQEVVPDQSEVVFTTAIDRLVTPLVPITYCLVEEFTGRAVQGARLTVAEKNHRPDGEQRGCGTLEVEPGWSIIRIEPYTERGAEPGTDTDPTPFRFAPLAFRVHTLPEKPLDLGVIRLSPAQTARFSVVDAGGRGVTGAEFTLTRQSTYDGTDEAADVQRAWSDAAGTLVFEHVAREPYVVTCHSPRLDAEPLRFDGARLRDDPSASLATIQVRPVRQISLVFDEPPPRGTLVMIETLEGLPVRRIEVDEFGVVPVWLGGTEYNFHLVVEGESTESRRLSVASDPFVLQIGR